MFGIKTRIKRVCNTVRSTYRNYRILSCTYGQFRTIRSESVVDSEGNPLPWITYPAIDYIKQLDLSDKRMFEYGSGFSTLFWAKRVRQVISVEDDAKWYAKLKPDLPPNVEYLFAEQRQAYAGTIRKFAGEFDIIVIDGIDRYDCAIACEGKLARGGFIILDNSEWCPRTSAFLREKLDLIEVDMYGFTAINDYTHATSFFFSRGAQLKPAGIQPMYLPGNKVLSIEELSEWIRG